MTASAYTGERVGGTDKLLADICKSAVRDLRHAPISSREFRMAAQFFADAGLLDDICNRHNLSAARANDAHQACREERA